MAAPTRKNDKPPAKSAQLVQAPTLSDLPWLIHGFSTRGEDGNFTLGRKGEAVDAAVDANRHQFLRDLGATKGRQTWPLVTLKQVHSAVVHHVNGATTEKLVGDGLITNTAGIVLAIGTADCMPVLIADPLHKAVGAFHAGWRGSLARIVEKGIGEMRRRFGSNPADLRAAIGPGIHACSYEVGKELRDKFEAQFSYGRELFQEVFESDPVRERYPLLFMTQRAPGHSDLGPKLHLDLVEANRRQLLDVGVKTENIWSSELCTACRTDLLFSYRAEGPGTGRMLGAIGIRE
jgi:polyphenol oxidase